MFSWGNRQGELGKMKLDRVETLMPKIEQIGHDSGVYVYLGVVGNSDGREIVRPICCLSRKEQLEHPVYLSVCSFYRLLV